MRNRHLYILCAVLGFLGIGVFLGKLFIADLPLRPKETIQTWEVEAHITFSGRNAPAKISLFTPPSTARYTILDQDFVSRGFGLSTEGEFPNKRLVFSKRRAPGAQNIYYRFVVHRAAETQEPRAALTRAIEKPDWKGRRLQAAQDLITEARAASADNLTLAANLLNVLTADPLAQNAAAVLGRQRDARGRAETAVKVLAIANIPANTVHGIELVRTQRTAPFVHWIEVWHDNKWHPFSLATAAQGVPDSYFPWWRGSANLASLEGGSRLNVNVSVASATEAALRAAVTLGELQDLRLVDISLFGLPLDVQQVYRVLLVVPLGVFVLVILRNLVGVRGFGTFMPVLIALAFRETQLLWGIVLFTAVVSLALAVRLYLENLKLLLVPRLAAVLIVVIGVMALFSLLTHKLGLDRGLSVSLFPMVILTMTVERMSVIWDERGAADAIKQGIGSLIIASICYVVMSNDLAEHILFVFPELMLVLLALTMLLGRYTGYRLVELQRFRSILRPGG